MNARGFKQVEGEMYQTNSIAAPVTNDVTIRVVLTMMLLAYWQGKIVDINGAFLHGHFENGEIIPMIVPKGFEEYYPADLVLLLLMTLYSLKQAAMVFWRELLKAMYSMGMQRSHANPCLYFSWTEDGLVIWLSWIDDCLVVGSDKAVAKAKRAMMERFECEDVGDIVEYIRCKIDIDREKQALKFTQPVLLQSYEDEFDLPNAVPMTPAAPGSVLLKGEGEQMTDEHQSKYRSGVGKLLHMMRWSIPPI
jgi:hypothetical protein